MKRIGISIGDPGGIGPEIALKAALDPQVRALCLPVVYGDRGALELHARLCGIAVTLKTVATASAVQSLAPGEVALVEAGTIPAGQLKLGEITAANGLAATQACAAAIAAAQAGELAAVVSAPQTEAAIHAAGIEFDGHPSFVARCTGTPVEDAFLMICYGHEGREMRVAHATLHVGLRRALELLTTERIAHAIRATGGALRRMGIAKPRIAVSGLNPHAGEGGLFGDEEQTTIGPAIAAAKSSGLDVDGPLVVEGPFGADTVFAKPGYDAYLVMFHDQGHILVKTQAPNRTAGLTIGTPILFSSVAHGSALDIAGQNRANHAAMIEAVRRLAGVS